ncbi:MAG TPA: ADOP family duplicated permease [Gammaproteobacteria bacterium]|nr:ADOP family duplicated permease [Gammaproteobacteria bacterium]
MLGSVSPFVRGALRPLRRNTGFVVLAGAMLALGIASTTAVFSLIRGTLLTPPPYEEPERLVFVSTARAEDRDAAGVFNWPEDLWQEWLADTRSLASIAGYRWVFNFLVLDEGSEALEGMLVSEEYFSVIGVAPQIGRAFVVADSEGTDGSAIILSHDLWTGRFEGDPEILGRTIRLSRQPPATVVGVMPPGIRFLPSPSVGSEPYYDLHAKVDFWQPIPAVLRERPAWNVIARLNPDVSARAAEAEIGVLLQQQAAVVPELADLGARLDPLMSVLNAEGRRLLLPLFAAAALVLLIACGNATALLLINGLRRQHEYGLRAAIGASRVRLLGLVLSESLLLAGLSAGVGVCLAMALVYLFGLAGGTAIPRLEDVTIGWPVLAFGVGAAVLACTCAALVPAVRAARLDPVDALRLGGSKSSGSRGQCRLLSGVVVGQVALTLALLVGAGLLIRTIYNLGIVEAGYDTRNILTMSVTAVDDDWQSFHQRALERVATLPGVEGAAFAWGVPLTGNSWPARMEIDGYTTAESSDNLVPLPLRAVTSGYFDLLRQPVTLGRDFRVSDDRDAPPVAIVNELFVERYLGGGNAIGRMIWLRGRENGPPVEIIGVTGDGRTIDLARESEPEVYVPLWQAQAFSKHLVVRAAASPASLAAGVRAALHEISPTVAVENVNTLEAIRGQSLQTRSFAMQLLIGFAVIACMLTLGGVYSVLSLSVVTRRREIAIRSAVGADPGRVSGLVLSQGLRMVVGGAAAGLLVSVALANLLQAWLFDVATTDPTTVLGATALFVVVALLACWIPAQRAARIEAAEALKTE